MSLYDYEVARRITGQDFPFYALIQAAMRQADTENGRRLQDAFPEVWRELRARYHTPGGVLPSDPEWDKPGTAWSEAATRPQAADS